MSGSFSVVVPLYNAERFLAATVDSILAQTLPARQVIIVDDCSTDAGPRIAESYGDKVQLIRAERNGGQQIARNLGIAVATGDWIAFCDNDDFWEPDYLERAAMLRKAAPEARLIFSNFKILRNEGYDSKFKFDTAPLGWWDRAGRSVHPEGWVFEAPLAPLTLDWQPIFPSGQLIARDLVEAAGRFDPAMRGLRPEDWEFTLRCLYRTKAAALPDPLVTIRKHGGNLSSDVVLTTADEATLLKFVKHNHPEAVDFHDLLDREIRVRRLQSFDGAFAQKRSAMVRQLWREVAPADRTLARQAKALCSILPEPLGGKMNEFLQRSMGGRF